MLIVPRQFEFSDICRLNRFTMFYGQWYKTFLIIHSLLTVVTSTKLKSLMARLLLSHKIVYLCILYVSIHLHVSQLLHCHMMYQVCCFALFEKKTIQTTDHKHLMSNVMTDCKERQNRGVKWHLRKTIFTQRMIWIYIGWKHYSSKSRGKNRKKTKVKL